MFIFNAKGYDFGLLVLLLMGVNYDPTILYLGSTSSVLLDIVAFLSSL